MSHNVVISFDCNLFNFNILTQISCLHCVLNSNVNIRRDNSQVIRKHCGSVKHCSEDVRTDIVYIIQLDLR